MYKPFSDFKNIDKMVRSITVFVEQESLEIDWDKESPFYKTPPLNYSQWVKYVSTKSSNPYEVYLYWDKKVEADFDQNLGNLLASKNGYFEILERYFLDSYQKLENFTDELFNISSSRYNQMSTDELNTLFIKFDQLDTKALSGYYIVFCCLDALLILVQQELAHFVSKTERVLEDISMLGIDSIVQEERSSFLRSLKKVQVLFSKTHDLKDPKIKEIIFAQWYKFGACVYAHKTSMPYSLKAYQGKYTRNILLDADMELKKTKKRHDEQLIKFEEILAKFKISPQLMQHIKWLRVMMGYRNKEELYLWAYFDHAMPMFSEIAKRLEIDETGLWLLSKEEIVAGLNRKVNVSKVVGQRRQDGFTIKRVGNLVRVFTGVKDEDWYEGKVEESVTDLIKGRVACTGKACGVARIIFDPMTESAKFKKGEILITSMTTPDFVPLMRKAAAVVTDEGGLLCHAAIVSRELCVPCIIGTKVATQTFKNGDMVEVDANEGQVSKLD